MSNTYLIPDNWRVHIGNQILESIQEPSNTAYYLFVADHVTRGDSGIPAPVDDPEEIFISAYRNMIFGKRITSADASMMIRNIPYSSNTAYAQYNDADPLLGEKDYYAITNAGSYSHVWKCLENDNGGNSAVTPEIGDVDENNEVFSLSDGYRWKYMYSVGSANVAKFATSSYFPLGSNADVIAAAVPGAIDVVEVLEEGAGYDNYMTGTFSTGDIRVNGNTVLYNLTSNSTARSTNGFYTGCMLYISTGTGVGQYKLIIDYFTNANGKFAVLESEFDTTPVNADGFEVYPWVTIHGDGQESTNAYARALINSTGNSVYRVEMLDRGAGYQFAQANVLANAVVGVDTVAEVRPIYSSQGGHGSSPETELRAGGLCFSVKISNSESNTIPFTNQFQQYGIIRDPSFANVQIGLSNTNLTPFAVDETVCKITNRLLIPGNATVNVANTTLTHATGNFTEQFMVGDSVYLVGTDSEEIMFNEIASVTNSSHMLLTTNCSFTDTNTSIHLANVEGECEVLERVSNTTIRVNGVNFQLETGDLLVGCTSGAKGQVANTKINDVARTGLWSTFVGMYKYTGSYSSGTFVNNEKVFEGANLASSTANASLHSAVSNGSTIVVYLSNVVGTFSSQIVGYNSGAVFSLGETFDPEITFGEGRVVYLENTAQIERSAITSENFNIVMKF